MPPLPEPDRPLVGRTDELADLTARAVESGTPSLTLLGGDAGVGKTRLLTELSNRARRAGARVLLGHCLDLGESSAPYLPLSEMFGRLAQDDHALAQRLVADRPLLGPLLPEYYRRDVPADLPHDTAPFFDSVHMVLEELAETQPVVAIIEDAHWADRSTRELLTFLFTRRFSGPVSLVVSYRSDDLNRRHPLRAKLAEWSRLGGVTRMSLDPLTDAEVRDLLRLLRPGAPTADAATIVERAGGNPFFAEELLAASELGRSGLPDELADLLLVRIDALDDDARAVVRAVSVAGRAVDHSLLARVVEVSGRDLDRALRTVVDSHVFAVTTSGGYTFRHALLGEAVYDDLLPGERVQLHWDFADALREQTGASASAALARHARAAGNVELALEASVRAGDEAVAAAGPADAARHYEDALAILSEHKSIDPPESRVSLALKAARALNAAGNPYRAADLLSGEYSMYAGDDTTERARLIAGMGRARLLADDRDAGADLLREAISWLDTGQPTPELADLYAVLARALIADNEFEASLLAATEAASLARDLDLPMLVTDAMTSIARLDDFAGDPAGAERALRDVVDRAREAGHASAELRALHQLARVQARMDRFRDAFQTHLEGYERSRATGHLTDPFGIETRVFGALYGLMIGEWDQADELLAPQQGVVLPPLMESVVGAIRMMRDHGRGADDVLDRLPQLRPLWPRDMFIAVHSSSIAVDVQGARGDLDEMLATYDGVVETFTSVWSMPSFDARIRLSALAIGHIASAVVQGRVRASAYSERVAALAAAVEDVVAKRRSEDALGLESRAWVNRARAEQGRFDWGGRGAVPDDLIAAWECSTEVFLSGEHPFETARSQLRLAELLASAGRRSEARELLDQVRSTAENLGARGLLAAAARGRRTSESTESSSEVTLTPREREVLTLVAEGRTNGEIAAALFISAKTASVHVSNILAKVGAATRTEAAAIARRDALI